MRWIRNQLYRLCGQKDQVTINEINIQNDHIHMIISIPPKYAISEMMGFLKGKSAIRLFQKQKELTKKYWGKHIWARGYCVSTVGLDEEKIRISALDWYGYSGGSLDVSGVGWNDGDHGRAFGVDNTKKNE